jgi:hypothetical protein
MTSQRELFDVGVSDAIISWLANSPAKVCRLDDDQGMDLYFPYGRDGRNVVLINAAANIAQKSGAIKNMGSMSVRKFDTQGNMARLTLNEYNMVIPDRKSKEWWSCCMIECDSAEKAEALNCAFQDFSGNANPIYTVLLSTAQARAELVNNEVASAAFEALATYVAPRKGLSIIKTAATPRYKLNHIVCLFDPSGSAADETRYWTNSSSSSGGSAHQNAGGVDDVISQMKQG